ncbi:FecR domain-containing protein, partial [Candidatus Riflebacteria bacterium]
MKNYTLRLLIVALFTFLAPVISQGSQELVTVRFVKGPVLLLRTGEKKWVRAVIDSVLYAGDQIRTDEKGRAVIQYLDISIIKLKPNSLCIPLPISSGIGKIKLPFGSAYISVKLGNRKAFTLEGAKATAGVRGTNFQYSELARQGIMQKILNKYPDLNNVRTHDPEVTVIDGKVELRSRYKKKLKKLITRGKAAILRFRQGKGIQSEFGFNLIMDIS